ncbi:response regulator transcription factor [Virgibacillus proomii]|jgi:DNA-binding response OmpR family regulator|uniref:response regulator transcription factor n=1 Tax=Virgibacillus proomii TaxID=84407 RepID=UPI0009873325|nr:response regulator transcription factor [Virgibacillus proomii]
MQATILLVEDDAEIARVIRDMFVRIWNQLELDGVHTIAVHIKSLREKLLDSAKNSCSCCQHNCSFSDIHACCQPVINW